MADNYQHYMWNLRSKGTHLDQFLIKGFQYGVSLPGQYDILSVSNICVSYIWHFIQMHTDMQMEEDFDSEKSITFRLHIMHNILVLYFVYHNCVTGIAARWPKAVAGIRGTAPTDCWRILRRCFERYGQLRLPISCLLRSWGWYVPEEWSIRLRVDCPWRVLPHCNVSHANPSNLLQDHKLCLLHEVDWEDFYNDVSWR